MVNLDKPRLSCFAASRRQMGLAQFCFRWPCTRRLCQVSSGAFCRQARGFTLCSCRACPTTAGVLREIPNLMTGIPFAYSFFSTLAPGSTIAPHFGASNLKLRCHLPLYCALRCASRLRQPCAGVFTLKAHHPHLRLQHPSRAPRSAPCVWQV